MKAMVYTRYGSPNVLQPAEIPTPKPGPGMLLVRVGATLATPTDCAFRSANPPILRLFNGFSRPKSPLLGFSFAGELVEQGEGATRFDVGQRLFGTIAPHAGTYVEYVEIPQDAAVLPTPAGLSDADAVALLDGYLTAMPFLREGGGIRAGMNVLINGASGSIGASAVQLAKHFGAEVTATCSAANTALVQQLGADRVIDYRREDFTRDREAYDIIFDTVGKSSFAKTRSALKRNGIYLTTVPSFAILATMLRVKLFAGRRGQLMTAGMRSTPDKAKDLQDLVDLVSRQKIRPVIDRIVPLHEAAAAHRRVETGHKVGSVVLSVTDAKVEPV